MIVLLNGFTMKKVGSGSIAGYKVILVEIITPYFPKLTPVNARTNKIVTGMCIRTTGMKVWATRAKNSCDCRL